MDKLYSGEIENLTQEEEDYIDNLPPFNVWYESMKRRIKKRNEKWVKRKANERANGIYK